MLTPLKVLIVEDSEDDALMLRHKLQKNGYDPVYERVETAAAMAAALQAKSWDLIIADYVVPGFNGLDSLRILKESGMDLPFILVSGKIGEEQAVGVMKAGAHDYVMKDKLTRLAPAVSRELKDAESRSQRRRAEAALQQSEAMFRNIFDNAVMGIFQSTPDGRLLMANPALVHMFGYDSPQEAIMQLTDLAQIYVEAGQCDNLVKILEEKGIVQGFEAQVFRKNREKIWISLNARKVLDQNRGAPIYEGTVENISARKMAEQALKESEEKYRLLVNQIPAVVYKGHADWSVDFFDPKIEELTGYPMGVFNSRHLKWIDLILPEDLDEAIRIFKTALKTNKCVNREYRIRKKEGEIVWLHDRGQIFCNAEGKIDHVSGVLFDITDRKQAEEDLRKTNEQLQALVKEFEQINREATLINRLSESLQSCFYADEAHVIVGRFARELFPTQSGALFTLDPSKNMVEIANTWGDALDTEKTFPPEDCWAIRRGQTYCGGSQCQEILCHHLPDQATSFYICLPLASQGETLGVLHLQGAKDFRSPTGEQLLRLATMVGDQISLALANLRLRETLRFQVMHDPLTGLFNRRYLEENLKREVSRVRRKKATLGAIMMDLDHFKHFNDTYGHEAGDNLLRVVGQFLARQVREEDIACRYGGEEFALIMPETSLKVIRNRAEEIRQGVARLQVFHQGQLLEGITVSAGVAVFPDHGYAGDEVLRAADRALYRAKAEGRNRTVTAERNTGANSEAA